MSIAVKRVDKSEFSLVEYYKICLFRIDKGDKYPLNR
jgi:hypothetical protein